MKQKHTIALFIFATFIFLTSANVIAAPAPVAPKFCQCVDYVRNRLVAQKIVGADKLRGNAKDWGQNLVNIGYHWTGIPQSGDIMVFQPTYKSTSGNFVNTQFGHIAFVESATFDAAKQIWSVTFFGANFPGKFLRSDSSCNNVTTSTTAYYEFTDETKRTVSFYYR